jgi:hypothetical protein
MVKYISAVLKLLSKYKSSESTERLGQYFSNNYLKIPDHTIFNSDGSESISLISDWLINNSYYDELPERVR